MHCPHSLSWRPMPEVKIPKEERGHVLAWVAVAMLAYCAFWFFLAWDVLSRWGQPLIVEFHFATLIWVAGLILMKISGKVLASTAERILETKS